MCELLGLAFNRPVTASVSFRGFRHRGAYNRDGWGLAWFVDGRPEIQKEPRGADVSPVARSIQDRRVSSDIFIGHVRYATEGGRVAANTHPFQQDFRGGSVVLAHNGTLHGLPKPALFSLEGETDSEQALCVLLSWMQEKEVAFSDFTRIESCLRELNQHGTMNMLFSNGAELFAYRDREGYNGLCYTQREAPFQAISLRDEDWTVDLSEQKRPSERGFVIATRPLTNGEVWTDLPEGRLLVIRGGAEVYGAIRG